MIIQCFFIHAFTSSAFFFFSFVFRVYIVFIIQSSYTWQSKSALVLFFFFFFIFFPLFCFWFFLSRFHFTFSLTWVLIFSWHGQLYTYDHVPQRLNCVSVQQNCTLWKVNQKEKLNKRKKYIEEEATRQKWIFIQFKITIHYLL